MLTEPRLVAQRPTVVDRLRERLDRGVREGDLAADMQTDQLASYLLAVIHGMSGCGRDGGSTEDVLAIVDTALHAVAGSASTR